MSPLWTPREQKEWRLRQLSPPSKGMARPPMRCFTDEELRRGIEAAIVGRHRCQACGGVNDDAHQDQAHTFLAPDVFDVFLQAARGHDPEDVAAGEPDAH